LSKSIGAQVFLARFLPLIEAGTVAFQPRNAPKTMRFLLNEDLDTDDVFAVLRELKAEELVSGPEGDCDGTPGSVMVFHHQWGGKLLYIKLKIWSDQGGDCGLVMSFHEEGTYE
jgi:hypothetical protein